MPDNKISVIIPVYNVERELDRCVTSIRQQTYSNLEIILVDDGSTDNCPVMCDKYKTEDDRVVVIHKKNGGLSSARNAGIREATGEYILYVDSDDYIELDSCAVLVREIQKGADIVSAECREIRQNQIVYQKHTNLIPGKIYTAKEYTILCITANEWYAPAWFSLYRRDFILKNNLFFKEGIFYEDMEMLPRLFLAEPRVIYIDYPFYNYVIRENSITSSKISDKNVEDSLNVYRGWKAQFDQVKDMEYQKYLYGCLIKYYLTTVRRMKICEWRINGVDLKFAMLYSMTLKERIKACAFHLIPKLYISV